MNNTTKEYVAEKARLNNNLSQNQKKGIEALNRFVSKYESWSYKSFEGTEADYNGVDYVLTKEDKEEKTDIKCSFRVRTTNKYNNFMIRKSGKYGDGEKSEYSKIKNKTTQSVAYVYYCETTNKLIIIETKLIGEYLNANPNMKVFRGEDNSTFVVIDEQALIHMAKKKNMFFKELPL